MARAARDWLIEFLKNREAANLGAALATLPRAQEIVGGIEAKLATTRGCSKALRETTTTARHERTDARR